MLAADAPVINSEALYDSLAAASGEPLLTAARRSVISSYGTYDRLIVIEKNPPVSVIAEPKGARAVALRENYKALRQVPFRYVRAAVLGSALGKCTLCGARNAGQMDHYLPQSSFPEFASMVTNLIPACEPCNKKKSTRYIRRTGLGRPYLQPYLHDLPAERFLSCSLKIEPDSGVLIEFDVFRSPSMDRDTFEILQEHFALLDLDGVFRDEAIGYATESLTDWYSIYRDAGSDGLSRTLRRQSVNLGRHYRHRGHHNHWKPLLLEAAVEHPTFCSGGFQEFGPDVPF